MTSRSAGRVRDVVIALALAVVAATGSGMGVHATGPAIRAPAMGDVWFDADAPRVTTSLLDRWSDKHQRAQVHPLFSLMTIPSYVMRAAGVDPETRVTVIVVATAALWVMTLYALLRLMGCAPIDATLFSLLGLASASAIFWLTVPESFGLGSVTVMLGLAPAAVLGARPGDRWFIAASAASLSITTTNWMAGLAATVASHRPWRSVRITVAALVVVVALWGAEKVFVPAAGFFLAPVRGEQRFMVRPTVSRAAVVVRQAIVGAMIAPIPGRVRREPTVPVGTVAPAGATGLTMQSPAGPAAPWSLLGVLLWVALLSGGAAEAWRRRRATALPLVLALFLAGQLGLHLIYGRETFLYALDYFPALLLLAAFTLADGPAWRRSAARAAAVVLIVLAAASNLRSFRASAAFVAAEGVRTAAAP
ncbi:MAG: hypothetical protein ABI637_00740 [Gemmatimonadota bacterium]